MEIDWNGTIVWDFKYSSNNYLSHYDIEYLLNGNILMIAWEAKNYSEAISTGRNLNITPMLGLWPDHIVEVKSTSPTSGEIVWEYVNPFPSLSLNAVFTFKRYSSNYSCLKNLFQQPKNPEKPNGAIYGLIGVKYNYTTVTTDPQDDQVYYLFDWGDKTKSNWIGPFNSSETISSSHIWKRRGKFNVKVMAKYIYGHQSGWSEPFSIYMPRSLILTSPGLNQLILKINSLLRFFII